MANPKSILGHSSLIHALNLMLMHRNYNVVSAQFSLTYRRLKSFYILLIDLINKPS